MTPIEELSSSTISVDSMFLPGTSLPLINLDWNATSKPLRSVEEELMSAAFKDYGNPHSCGTLTSSTSSTLIENSKLEILRSLGLLANPYEISFGGDGSSYWLEKLSTLFTDRPQKPVIVTFQDDLHNSLVNPFVTRGFKMLKLKTFEWVRDYIQLNESTEFVFLISLMSHLTGDVFNWNGFTHVFGEDLDRDRVKIIVDGTSWFVHQQTIPRGCTFDYLVFSGHKFPGGPGGTPGAVIYSSTDEDMKREVLKIPGTPNVLGISRLAISTRLRYRLLKEDRSNEVQELYQFLLNAKESNTRFVLHSFNSPGRKANEGTTAAVFCFSVELNDCKKLLHPQVVGQILLNAYGIQVRSGGQCAEACINKLPQWENLNDVDLTTTPILQPSVCRISIPGYLLTREFLTVLKEKLIDFLRVARYFLKCFEPTFQGWNFREDFLLLTKNPKASSDSQTLKPCKTCSGRAVVATTPSSDSKTYGIMIYSKINGGVLQQISFYPRQNTEHYSLLSHPFRWFAIPNDIAVNEI